MLAIQIENREKDPNKAQTPNTRQSHRHTHTLCVVLYFVFTHVQCLLVSQWKYNGNEVIFSSSFLSKDRSFWWSDLVYCRLLLIMLFRYIASCYIIVLWINWINSKFVCKLIAMDANVVGSVTLFSLFLHLQFTIYRTCLSNIAICCFSFWCIDRLFLQIFLGGSANRRDKTEHCFR